jgi:enamine deaminase RidA (YjgF/YER057c/UK114 family)
MAGRAGRPDTADVTVARADFKAPPPRTTVGTTGLLVKDALIEIDLIGVR